MDDKWRKKAACLGLDTEIFYQDVKRGGDPAYVEARKICNACPVKTECLEDALEKEALAEMFGMRGGKSARERAKLWKRRNNQKEIPIHKDKYGHPMFQMPNGRYRCKECHTIANRKYRTKKKFEGA